MKPVADLTQELVALDAPDLDSVYDILMQTSVAWITKSENKKLKPFGRSKSPLEDYAKAGICLLP